MVIRQGDRRFPVPPSMIGRGPAQAPPGMIRLPPEVLALIRR
jgi:hypothetical protein